MPKVEAKNFKRPTVCSCGFSSQSMISEHTTNSEARRSAQTPTGGGAFQRAEKSLGSAFSSQLQQFVVTFTLCGLSERKKKKYGVYTVVIYIFKKNVNIGQRCSSLHTVQSHGLC